MLRAPGGRPLPFEAVSEFAVDAAGFFLAARFPIAPLLTMRIHDGMPTAPGGCAAASSESPSCAREVRRSRPAARCGTSLSCRGPPTRCS